MKYSILLFLILTTLVFLKNARAQNPLLEPYSTPHGIIPFEKVELEHILPALKSVLEETRQEIQDIIDNLEPPTFENTIAVLATSGHKRFQISRYASMMGHTYNTPELNAIISEVSQLNSDYLDEVLLNTKLFARIKSVYLQRENLTLSQEEQTLLDYYYSMFARNGNDLPKEQKVQLKEIKASMSELSVLFGQNVTNDRDRNFFYLSLEDELEGLPDWVIASAAEHAKKKEVDGWVIPLQSSLTYQFLSYSERRELREKLMRDMMKIGNNDNEYNNLNLAKELLNLRLEMAQLLGYSSYVDYALEETMVESSDQLTAFLDEYKDYVKPIAQLEVEAIRNFAKTLGFDDEIQQWDFSYFNRKYKEVKYQFNPDEVKPFLPVHHVINESFAMVKDMWGLDFKSNLQLPKYHVDQMPFEVYDANGMIKAVMYLDLFEREGKVGGARLSSMRLQNKENGYNEIPVLTMLCNFSNPVGDAPTLMRLYDLEIFLHELGHGLHVMLSDVTYSSQSGYNLRYDDFVELPSMLLQKWTYEPEFLKRVSRHYQTDQPIPQDLIDKIIISKKEDRALFAMNFEIPDVSIDIVLHSIQKPFEGNLCDWENKFIQEYSILPVVDGICYIPSFNHIFSGGYAAGYYTYDWSDMMAWDIFDEFKKNGIFDPVTAKRFEQEILSKGGTLHPRELFKNFMGRDISMKAFLENFDFE